MDIFQALLLTSYGFTAGCYMFVWSVWRALMSVKVKVATLGEHLTNHWEHELQDVKRRLDDLERGE